MPATDKTPRLLVLASTYPRWPDDTEPGFIHELCLRLADTFEVCVVTPHAPGALRQETMDGVEIRRYRYAPARLETLVHDGGIVTNLKRQPWKWLLVPNFFLGLLWTTWRQIRRWRPDVVHVHWLIPQGMVMALLSLLSSHMPRFIVSSHGSDLFAFRTWPFTALKRFVARRAEYLTVVSYGMKQELKHLGVPTEKIFVEPMGADLEKRFTPNPSTVRAISELLFVGRLVEKKGVKYLLDALPAVLQNHPGAFLTIAGFGPEESALRKQAESLAVSHNVHFVGAVSQKDLPQLYRRATLFVAPFIEARSGDQEGLGLVTVEAIGCGCPAIVTDIPATRDVITQDAFRVDPCSPVALSTAISLVLAMPPEKREALAFAQRKKIRRRFDWSQRAASYSQLLKNVAGPS